jgi:hypothetical protein
MLKFGIRCAVERVMQLPGRIRKIRHASTIEHPSVVVVARAAIGKRLFDG